MNNKDILHGLEHGATDGLIQFRIFGEPQPFPKKGVNPHTKVPYSLDYRTRKNPFTKKIEIYDRGYKAKWGRLVRNTVDSDMFHRGLQTYPKNHPILMGMLFYLTKSPSCKLEFPSQAPDEDNFAYHIRNVLKRTPAKKNKKTRISKPGKIPNGILYYDDHQTIFHKTSLFH